MKKKEIQQNLLNKHSDLLYVLLFAFGGACSKRQIMELKEATEPLLKDLRDYPKFCVKSIQDLQDDI